MTNTKTVRPKDRKDAGHANVRISKAAHHEISKRAIAERRTFVAQLDLILGV